uniref:Uncharacterized protein n=1 Tax=Romanomermis culicivorax TaxID=13658 RepID=A0A915HRX2_ROMCU
MSSPTSIAGDDVVCKTVFVCAGTRRCVHRASGQEFTIKFVILRRVGMSRRGAKRAGIECKIEILGILGSHGNIIHFRMVREAQPTSGQDESFGSQPGPQGPGHLWLALSIVHTD